MSGGEQPVILRTGAMEVSVLPGIGGKIAQIRDLRCGHSFLVPPQRPLEPLSWGSRWTSYDTSGMDDCFPNIDECPYPLAPALGVPLPQMGEWVYGAWRVTDAADTHVTLERGGSLLPYTARKTIGFAAADTLRIDYRVENCGEHPLRYLWSAHPLIAVEDDYEIVLPPGALRFVTFPPQGREHEWPHYCDVDLSRQWLPLGDTLKIFITGLREGWCELRTGRRRLRFEFDPSATPVLGVWFNHFGFPADRRKPFRAIAIEPCTSASDVFDLPGEAYPVIAPNQAAQWWLTIRAISA